MEKFKGKNQRDKVSLTSDWQKNQEKENSILYSLCPQFQCCSQCQVCHFRNLLLKWNSIQYEIVENQTLKDKWAFPFESVYFLCFLPHLLLLEIIEKANR